MQEVQVQQYTRTLRGHRAEQGRESSEYRLGAQNRDWWSEYQGHCG